ncbi:MAG: hypothetical protein V2I82_02175 [Halieaceae bacterium]|jgi:hypothetical protein|nr:hypothetical protein [Halieaceae bacterium]
MLTETGYSGALAVYLIAALLAIVLINLWLLSRSSLGLRALVTLPLAALLLTPAYIDAGADTLAPALVVAVFQAFSQGLEAADHSLRPLLLFTGVGAGVGAAAFLLDFWRRRRAAAAEEAAT